MPATKIANQPANEMGWSALRSVLPQSDLLEKLINRSNLPISLHCWQRSATTDTLVYANPALCSASKMSLQNLVADRAVTLDRVASAIAGKVAEGRASEIAARTNEPISKAKPEHKADIIVTAVCTLPNGDAILARVADFSEVSETVKDNEDGLSEEALLGASKFLSASIEQMLETTNEADEGSTQYQIALADFRDVLASKPDIGAVNEAVNKISEQTVALAAEFQQTRQRLAESSKHIEELRKTLEIAQQQGLIDQLTTIGNRRFFDIEAGRAVEDAYATGTKFCLLLVDIDHFKSFNDEHGHQTGDMILRMVARSLSTNIRATDVVARYGGEEFAILLPDTEINQSRVVAEKVRKDVAQRRFKKRVSGENLGGVTISIGIAEWKTGDKFDETVEKADKALYAAKNAGRNRIATSTE